MNFPLGKPLLVMLTLAALSGIAIFARPGHPPRADLVLWCFADSHANAYRGDPRQPATQPTLVQQFQAITGHSVDVQLLSYRAENVRLGALFMGDVHSSVVPDAVEIEIGQVGQFFRPPINDVGLLPLNDFLQRSGWMDKILKARFAPWTKDGRIFGVPHDVHPVTLTYRDDLFRQAGIDLAQPRTWGEFHDACVAFQDYWRDHGHPDRHAIELPAAAADDLIVMLLQRQVNVIDAHNRIHMNDPKVAQTLAFYAQLVAGPRQIAAQSGGEGALSLDLNGGNICCFFTPDWRLSYLKDMSEIDPATGQPRLAGKMRMRELPIFDSGDAPTSTWGGTMIGIPRACPHPEQAWKLIEFLYLSPQGLAARRKYTNILSPVISTWNDPIYDQGDPYFGGQKIERLSVELARQLPERYVTPATPYANAILAYVLDEARDRVENHGADGLEEFCHQWLVKGQADLQMRIDHGRIDETSDSAGLQPGAAPATQAGSPRAEHAQARPRLPLTRKPA